MGIEGDIPNLGRERIELLRDLEGERNEVFEGILERLGVEEMGETGGLGNCVRMRMLGERPSRSLRFWRCLMKSSSKR